MKENSKIYLNQKGYEEHLRKIEILNKELINVRLKRRNVTDSYDIIEIEDIQIEETRIVSEIKRLYEELTRIVIVEKLDNDEIIDIDDVVVVNMKLSPSSNRDVTLRLVGTDGNLSADIQEVSINSPIGKAIYGKKVGDECFYSVNNRKISVLIKSKINFAQKKDAKNKKLVK